MKQAIPFIIAISQQKGGVGKTTTALCMGTELAQRGYHCLLVDLSPSGNLTSALGFSHDQLPLTSRDLFQNGFSPEKIIRSTVLEGVKIIPSNHTLSEVSHLLFGQQGYKQVLRQYLTKVHFSNYDFIILDCPPGIGPLTENALASASLVIVPLECEVFSLQTLQNMFQLIKNTRSLENPQLAYRLLITKMDSRDSFSEQACNQIKLHYKSALFKTMITFDHNLPQSQLAGIPLSICHPKSQSSQQYQILTKEILSVIDQEKSLFKEIEVN